MNAEMEIRQKKNLQFNWLVVFLLLPLTFVICYWQQFNGLYGPEAHENQRYMESLFAFLTGGPAPISNGSPIAFPLAGAIFSLIIPHLYSLQFVSIAAAGVCYILFCRLLNLLYPEGTQRQRFAFLILFLSPFYFRAALVGLSEMLSMAFLMWSLLECYKWNQTKSSQAMLLSTCAAVLAIQTRYSTGLLLLPVLPMIWTAVRSRLSLLLITIFVIVITLTPSIFLKGQDGLDIILHPWLSEWSPLNLFRSTFEYGENKLSYALPNIAYILSTLLHPGFCLIGIIFIFFSLKIKLRLPKSWVLSHVIFLFFIAGLPVQDLRLLLPAFPIALLVLYPSYELLIFKFSTRNLRVAVYLLAVVTQILLSVKVISPIVSYQREEFHIAQSLKRLPAETLNTFAIDGALRTYEVPQEVVNMWNSSYPLYNNGDLLLFNQRRFDLQYPNSAPVKIFYRLRQQRRLVFVTSYTNGWELYRIKQ